MREKFGHSVGKAILSPKNQQKFRRWPGVSNSGHIHPGLTLHIKLPKLLQGVACFHPLCCPPLLDKRVDKELISKAGVGRKIDHRRRLAPVRDWTATRLVLALFGC